MVIQDRITKVKFARDGARDWRQTLSVRIQSEGVLRQLGVLSFPYESANEEVAFEYVRVKKPDGSIITTSESSAVDTTAEIASSAPTYSDLRQKQIPVKGLGVGDVLEYSVHSYQRKPEIPGQFWYEQIFETDVVVLNDELEVGVPLGRSLTVSSGKLKYATHNAEDQRIYSWTYSQTEQSKPQDNSSQNEGIHSPGVRITTFKDWQQVGSWWGSVAAPEAAVTPAIQAKCRELTAGLSNDDEKARAIYKFVALNFRYISISFGVGRYRPHSSEEVLANQYGDCKDKHTLLAALLTAAGIQAWPALVGAGIEFDPSVPSPSQFNHVITVLPRNGKYVWLDTTQEVAPFGLLNPAIRDEQVLVIPTSGQPFLSKTPADPPFHSISILDVKSSLSDDGSLSGHFDIQVFGDDAVALRYGFRQLAPAQWRAAAQQLSFALNFAGDVSNVQVEGVDDLDKPFHYTYDYKRQKYSDWEEAKITPPLPPIGLGPGDGTEKPIKPFAAGSVGEVTYRASVALPKGFSIDKPEDVFLKTEFADYSAQYSFIGGVFLASRKLTIKQSTISVEQWADYQKFAAALRTDQSQFLMVAKDSTPTVAEDTNISGDPVELLRKATLAVETDHNYNKAIGLTKQANAVWKKSETKPSEYAESLVLLSWATLEDDYAADEKTGSLYVEWSAQTADLLREAVDVCSENPNSKPGVLALALELQTLQATDKVQSEKLRNQALEIRRKLTQEILPKPVTSTSPATATNNARVQSPLLVKKVEPVYTEVARAIRIDGTVHLALVVEADGTPSSVSLIEGLGFGLDEQAAKAVKQWRFKPGLLDGTPVRVRVRIEVTFKLL